MTYNKHISFYFPYLCLIFVLGYMFFGVESYSPIGRTAHSSILVGSKLYFFGGINESSLTTNEVFYLDLDQPFNAKNPPWVDFTSIAAIPFRSAWATVEYGYSMNNPPNIYLFGGITSNITTYLDSFTSFIYIFNVNSLKWGTPTVNGTVPVRRRGMKAIRDNSEKIYIFGGEAIGSPGSPPYLLNDTVIFNTVTLIWSIDYPVIIPRPRAFYSATLLSNGVIVYIGGYEGYNGDIVDISQISLYYTNSSTWSIKTAIYASTNPIENRSGHTAVLAPNGEIIVYGGSKNINNARVIPDIIVLNTAIEPFEWTVPLISSIAVVVPPLVSHTANRVGDYMIVAFGYITQLNAEPLGTNPDIYLMDIRNYTWVNSFEPTRSTMSGAPRPSAATLTPTSTPTEIYTSAYEDNSLIIIVLATVAGFIFIIICGFLIYRYRRRSNVTNNNDQNNLATELTEDNNPNDK